MVIFHYLLYNSYLSISIMHYIWKKKINLNILKKRQVKMTASGLF
jgi:hypothetical protein